MEDTAVHASRVYIKTKDANDPKLISYLDQQNYHLNKDKVKFSRIKSILQNIVSALGVFGILVIVLGIDVVFILSAIDDCKKQRQSSPVAYLGLLTKMACKKCGQNMASGLFNYHHCCLNSYRTFSSFIQAIIFCKSCRSFLFS